MDIDKIVEETINNTFRQELTRLSAELARLIEENVSYGGDHAGFLYGGRFLSMLPKEQHKLVKNKQPPNVNLVPQVATFFVWLKKVENECQQLRQQLKTLLRDCRNMQDIRDALPESAKDFAPIQIFSYSRTREEGYTLKHRLMGGTDFARINDTFLFYLANRMLY